MTLPSPSSLILVAVMNNPRDLEIARLLGWYRIPLRTAPKVIAVDYLAFYQTGAFGEDRWCIRYCSAVRGHELASRAELLKDELDHPRAKEEYFKIQIGPLESLPNPIPADHWRRLTFLYTTGEYLYKAQTLNDLVVHSDERRTLWQSLRERANREQTYLPEDTPELDVDPEVLAAILGIRELEASYNPSGSQPEGKTVH